MTDQGVAGRGFIGLQHLLPQHLLSRLVRSLAHIRVRWFSRALIRAFLRHYAVDLAEAVLPEPGDYATFNEFFTRRLRPGRRPLDADPRSIVCPVDGVVSQSGRLAGDQLLQAKGIRYSAAALFGGDRGLAAEFADGGFATLYLAPHNYHRIHMPLAGMLRIARFVPGDLFGVNAATAAGVPDLFVRNERIACVFDTAAGPVAVVLVGALFVGSMSLAWYGDVLSPRPRRVLELPADPPVRLERGAELGRFNMGSTVILMLAPGRATLIEGLQPGRPVRVGERLAMPA